MASLFRLCFVVIVLGLLAIPGAHADNNKQRASKHVAAGDRLKEQAEAAKDGGRTRKAKRLFAAASFEYKAAYDLVPHPLMLYNLAQVARLTGKVERALSLYQKYLEEQPAGDAADFARSYIRFLERKAKPVEKPVEKPLQKPLKKPLKKPLEKPLEKPLQKPLKKPAKPKEQPAPQEEEIIRDPAPPQAESKDGGKPLRYAGIGIGAAGLVSIAIGAKFGLDARSISTTLSNHDSPWTDTEVRLDKEGQDAGKKMLIFTGVGAAAMVTGGLLYFLGRSKPRASREQVTLQLTPQVDSRSFGLGLLGRF